MQKYSTQQLVERLKAYWIGIKDDMENKEPMIVYFGSEDNPDATVEFYIVEVIDYGHFDYDKRYHRFDLRFHFKSMQGEDATNTVSISLDAHERRIELAIDGYINGGKMDDINNVPLIVSYSKQEGKKIILCLHNSDAPKMYEEEVLLAELLFNNVATQLGMIPEKPFDFTSIQTYARIYEDIYNQIASLWSDLSHEDGD